MMKNNATTSRKFIFLAMSAMLITCFQNCSNSNFNSNAVKIESSDPKDGGGSGSGYDGKVYVLELVNGLCEDGSKISSAIAIRSGKTFLVRDNCRSLETPLAIEAQVSSATGNVLFNGASYAEAQGTTYYVDSSSAAASDAGLGTSPSAPLKSLAPLNKRLWIPGDTIAIKAGTTYSATVPYTGAIVIATSGTAQKPITFTSYSTGAKPVISNAGSWSEVIFIKGAKNVVLDGLALQGAFNSGVRIDGDSTQISVKNCEISQVGQGFEVDGHDNIFSANYIHDLNSIVNTASPSNDDYGANAFVISGNNNEFAYNRIIKAKAPSADFGSMGGGFKLWGKVAGISIHHNWVEDSNEFLEGGGPQGEASDVVVSYNVSLNNGIFFLYHNSADLMSNIRLENNTIVDTTSVSAMSVVYLESPAVASELNFRNNIVVVNQLDSIFKQHGSFHSNNLFQLLSASTHIYSNLDNSLATAEAQADPMFANIAAKDFHLLPGSPALGVGINLGYSINYDDGALPATPNLGAF